MAFSFLAQQYAVDTKAIQGACEKAMTRGKFAQYVEQKGARTAVTPKELNPLNPDGLTYEPDEPELYEANKAGASALIPPAIDKAITKKRSSRHLSRWLRGCGGRSRRRSGSSWSRTHRSCMNRG